MPGQTKVLPLGDLLTLVLIDSNLEGSETSRSQLIAGNRVTGGWGDPETRAASETRKSQLPEATQRRTIQKHFSGSASAKSASLGRNLLQMTGRRHCSA